MSSVITMGPPPNLSRTKNVKNPYKSVAQYGAYKDKQKAFRTSDINSQMHLKITSIDNTIDSFIGLHKVQAYSERASAYAALGLFSDAIEDYSRALNSKALKNDPLFMADLYMSRSHVHFKISNFDKANNDFGKAFKIKKKASSLHHNSTSQTSDDIHYDTLTKDPRMAAYALLTNFEDNTKYPIETVVEECFRSILGANGAKYFEPCIVEYTNLTFGSGTIFENPILIGFWYKSDEGVSVFDSTIEQMKKRTTLEEAVKLLGRTSNKMKNKTLTWPHSLFQMIENVYGHKKNAPKSFTSSGNVEIWHNEAMDILIKRYKSTLKTLYNKEAWVDDRLRLQKKSYGVPLPCFNKWVKDIAPGYLFFKDGIEILRRKKELKPPGGISGQ